HALGHAAYRVGHLGQRDQADVRQPEQAGGGAEATEEDRLQAGRLDQPSGEDVVSAEAADDARLTQELSQSLSGTHGNVDPPEEKLQASRCPANGWMVAQRQLADKRPEQDESESQGATP